MAGVLQPARDWADAALREAFNDAFADYLVGPPRLSEAQWPAFLRRQGVDRGASRVVAEAGRVIGLALVGRHGGRTRLATMGVRPTARGRGVAQRLLDAVLEASACGGASGVELEVFAQNQAALALYRSRGFEQLAELCGYQREPGGTTGPRSTDGVEPVALAAALAWLRAPVIDALPYQVSADALAAEPGPLSAWRCGAAQLVFRSEPGLVTIASLVDRGRDPKAARALARALAAAYPEARLQVAQLQRAELGGDALQDEGWQRLALRQWLMRRPADAQAGFATIAP